jgi:DNA primase
VTSEGWSKAVCPFHKDTKPSFYINLRSGYWHCFGCGAKGWLQQLLDRLNVKSIKAEDIVSKKIPERRKPNEVNYLPDYILGAYYACPTRLLSAGFKKDILKEYEVGFDSGLFRITFPIRDMNGKLAAVSGRNLEGEPKYQVYTYEEEFPEYAPRPKDHLYNLHRLTSDLESDSREPLYIVEGYKACLWLVQHGFQAVALMGAQMTRKQRNLISMYDVPIVLCLDNDDAGRAATTVNYLELSRSTIARVVEYPEGIKQPDDMPEDLLHKTLETPQEFRRYYELQRQHEDGAGPLPLRRKAFFHKQR